MKFSVLATSFFLGSVLAELPELVYHEDELAVTACKALIAKTATLYGKKDKKAFCNIENQPALGTMAHCLVQGFNGTSLEQKSVAYFIDSCSKYKLTEAEFEASYKNATAYMVDTTTVSSFNKTKLFSSPVKLKTKKIQAAYWSDYTRFFNYNWSTWFGTALVAYWFAIIIAAGIVNISYFLFPNFINSTFNGTVSKSFRKYISLPALVSKSHANPFNFKFLAWIIPTRLESILIAGWYVMALAFSIAHISHTGNNFVWASEEAEIGRKVADRTGIIANFLCPAVILFAGRNNFLQWISGWTYSRMVIFHKWTARCLFLFAAVHGISMSCSGIALGKFESRNAQAYARWGYVALIAMTLMVIQSIYFFRSRNYEIFVGIHVVLAVLAVCGCWIHTRDDGYQHFYYAAAAVWVFDRAMRLARLFVFGVRTATVELKANETVRVSIPRPKYWKPFPGCHAFIHFMRPTCFWQSHPFTIVDSVVDENDNHSITFYLKVKGGMTHGLYQYLARQPNHTANIKVSVEGPYGNRLPLDRFKNAIFFAGGNGIPGLYSEAISLARRESDKSTQRIKLYWVIRHWKSIEWFYEELKKIENTRIETVIYVTQPGSGLAVDEVHSSEGTGSDDDVDKDNNEKEFTLEKGGKIPLDFKSVSNVDKLKQDLKFIEFREGRPHIREIVQQDIAESEGLTGIVSCAHGSMVDAVRCSIIENIDSSKDRIEYFEQIQNW